MGNIISDPLSICSGVKKQQRFSTITSATFSTFLKELTDKFFFRIFPSIFVFLWFDCIGNMRLSLLSLSPSFSVCLLFLTPPPLPPLCKANRFALLSLLVKWILVALHTKANSTMEANTNDIQPKLKNCWTHYCRNNLWEERKRRSKSNSFAKWGLFWLMIARFKLFVSYFVMFNSALKPSILDAITF